MAASTLMDNYNPNNQSTTQQSEIQSFYNDATVFLTGATGFMGNLILEKLMRYQYFTHISSKRNKQEHNIRPSNS